MKRLECVNIKLLLLLICVISTICVQAAPESGEVNNTSGEKNSGMKNSGEKNSGEKNSGEDNSGGNNSGGNNSGGFDQDTNGITGDKIRQDLRSILKCARNTKSVGVIIVQIENVMNIMVRFVPRTMFHEITGYANDFIAFLVDLLLMLSEIMKEFTDMATPLLEFRWMM